MRRRGRPATRRAIEALVPPPEEHVDESAYVPPPTVHNDPMPSEPLQTEPSSPPEVVGGHIPLEQMAQLLATALRQPREPVASIERGRKLGAWNYDGFGDPKKASSWLEGNERVYQVMKCTDEQMVTFSAFLLRDRALEWWWAVQRRFPEGVSWAQFKEEFTDKFVPSSYRDAKAGEFFRLEQGILSVTDYEQSFSELVRHVPFIRDDEVSKTKRFSVGLSPVIRTTVASTVHTQYGQVVEAVVRVERSIGLKSQATLVKDRNGVGRRGFREVSVSSSRGEERHSGPVAASPVRGHSLARVQ